MMINVQNCTQNFLAKIFVHRRRINCNAFEEKYFSHLEKCYRKEKNFCRIFKQNRSLFMRHTTAIMFKKPR